MGLFTFIESVILVTDYLKKKTKILIINKKQISNNCTCSCFNFLHEFLTIIQMQLELKVVNLHPIFEDKLTESVDTKFW